jgi:hypothetical protein
MLLQNTPATILSISALDEIGAIEGVKLGQIWLVSIESLDAFLTQVCETNDRRYGPRVYHEYVSEQ